MQPAALPECAQKRREHRVAESRSADRPLLMEVGPRLFPSIPSARALQSIVWTARAPMMAAANSIQEADQRGGRPAAHHRCSRHVIAMAPTGCATPTEATAPRCLLPMSAGTPSPTRRNGRSTRSRSYRLNPTSPFDVPRHGRSRTAPLPAQVTPCCRARPSSPKSPGRASIFCPEDKVGIFLC